MRVTKRYTLSATPVFPHNNIFELLEYGELCGAHATPEAADRISDACKITGGTFYGGEFNAGEFEGGTFYGGTYNGGVYYTGWFFSGDFQCGEYPEYEVDNFAFFYINYYTEIFDAYGNPIPVAGWYDIDNDTTEIYPI